MIFRWQILELCIPLIPFNIFRNIHLACLSEKIPILIYSNKGNLGASSNIIKGLFIGCSLFKVNSPFQFSIKSKMLGLFALLEYLIY